MGQPDPERICTSIIERQNLSVRMGTRRFTRLIPDWRVIGNGYMLLAVESIPGISVLRRFI
jgi:hypothetical protein